MKALINDTRKVDYEGRRVFICWDLWFEVLQISNQTERFAPFDHFISIVNKTVNNTENIFYN